MKAVVLLSGGIDSAVCLWWARRHRWDLLPLTVEYFRRPEQEVRAIEHLLKEAGVQDLIRIPLSFLKEVDDLKKEGLRNDLLAAAPDPYIPARNLIFYGLAGHYAEVHGATVIVGGHNGVDPDTFPDSSPDFFSHVNSLYRMGLWSFAKQPVTIRLPLAGKSKAEVLRMGRELGVPFEHTWSCYWDRERHCGTCGSCVERKEAFRAAGVKDPTAYEA